MRSRALFVLLLLAAPAAGQGRTRSAPATTPPPSAAEEVYRMGREALARGAFDVAARLFRAVEDDEAVAGTAGYAFNRAQAARFLPSAGEAVYWYGRYLALSPSAPDAATVRDLASKLLATAPKPVRAEALRRARLEWERALSDAELERALRACPEARLEVRFAREGVVLGGSAYLYPARVVYWQMPEGEEAGTMWVVPTVPVAPAEELAGHPLLFLPPGRAIPLPIGPGFVSPPLMVAPAAPPGFPPDPALAPWRVEVAARLEPAGPPLLLVARQTVEALFEVRSDPAEATVALAKKRRDAPAETMPLAYGPRPARADGKVAPKGLIAVVLLPEKDGSHQAWGAPLSLFDVANRFGRLTDEAGRARLWVRGEPQGPSLLALGK